VPTLKRRSVQLDRKSIWDIATRIEELLEHEITEPIEQQAGEKRTKGAAHEHCGEKARKLLIDHNCTKKDDDPPKQRYSAFGQALFVETFGFTLPKKKLCDGANRRR